MPMMSWGRRLDSIAGCAAAATSMMKSLRWCRSRSSSLPGGLRFTSDGTTSMSTRVPIRLRSGSRRRVERGFADRHGQAGRQGQAERQNSQSRFKNVTDVDVVGFAMDFSNFRCFPC